MDAVKRELQDKRIKTTIVFVKNKIVTGAFYVLLTLLLSFPALLNAQYFDLLKYESITPVSVPVFESFGTGSSNIGMTTLRFRATQDPGPSGGTFRVKSIEVRFTETGNFDEASDITAVKVYKDDGDNLYERVDDTTAANNWTGASGPYNFSGGVTKVVDIDTSKSAFDANWTRLYISYDFSNGADSPSANLSANINCEVVEIIYYDDNAPVTVYTENPSTPSSAEA